MAQVTHQDLNQLINIPEIEDESRQKWERAQRRRRGLSQWIVRLLPLSLLVMLAVFYALSAPHTAELLNKITPGVGWIAPIGFELGVLLVAALREAGWTNRMTKWILIGLLGMSIVINVAGGFVSVVSTSGVDIQQDTAGQLLARFSTLPASAQAVLLLVIPLGILIPIMGKFAGEAVVKFSLNKIELTQENDEDRWLKERRKVLYQALYNAAVRAGAGAATSGNWASVMIRQYYREALPEMNAPVDAVASANVGKSTVSAVQPVMSREIGFTSVVRPSVLVDSGQIADDTGQMALGNNGIQVQARRSDAREIVRKHLEDNPADVSANVRELATMLNVGKSTVSAVQREMRETRR